MGGYIFEGFPKEIWQANYQGPKDKIIEDTWMRESSGGAVVESDPKYWTNRFYDELFYDFKFLTGGRIAANIAIEERAKTTLMNCFTHNPFDIKMQDPDSIEGIYKLLLAQAQTLKSEGGWGTNFSYLRPRGTYIKGIGSRTPGVLKFMELWDKSSEIITSGSDVKHGKDKKEEKKKIRKGAQMAVLSIWHKDIEEFISAKTKPNYLTKFNMSVGITDGVTNGKIVNFMDCVKNDENWDFIFADTEFDKFKTEWDGDIINWFKKGYPIHVYGTVKARDLWDKITKATYTRNEPGIMFLDLANKLSPMYYTENILQSNPCQPAWAKVLTRDGIREFKDIDVGTEIWSTEGWTKIVKKWSTGTNKVFKYKTNAGVFYGTESHKLVSNGEKVAAREAESVDIIVGVEDDSKVTLDPQDVMDGLVLGDGSIHAASNNLVYLCIGQNDNAYFSSGINHLLKEHRPGIKEYAWEVETTITPDELPKTYERRVPSRFMQNRSKIIAFLYGLYSANGSICGGRVTLKSASEGLVEDVQLMLNSIGIKSYVTTNKPHTVKFSNGEYLCKESYDLNITTDRKKFLNLIGFIQQYKVSNLVSFIENAKPANKSKSNYDITDVSLVSEEETFDITVDNASHTYWTQGCNVSNCGEILMSTGVCNLGAINLAKFVKKNENGFEFDYDSFKNTVSLSVRYLDNINDISPVPLPEYKESMLDKRRIGLGVMGLGSIHFMLGVRYGSPESLALIEKIWRAKAETELLTSAKLGKEKGNFRFFDKDKYFTSYWWSTLNIDSEVKKEIEKIGCMRNGAHSCNAPTGNTGIFAQVVSGGIEPIFSKEYRRWVIVNQDELSQLRALGMEYPDTYKSEWFETKDFKFAMRGDEQILKGTFSGNMYEIDKSRGVTKSVLVEDYGWKFVKENFTSDKIKELEDAGVFATTESLSVSEHLEPLKIISHYINMNSSKTINLPHDYSFEDFKNVYLKAYEYNIKGVTTYRANTMTAVLETVTEEEKKASFKEDSRFAPKRPIKLPADIHRITVKGEKWIVFTGLLENKPYEVFAGKIEMVDIPAKIDKVEIVKKAKGIYEVEHDSQVLVKDLTKVFSNDMYEAMTRMISTSLRHNVNLEFIVDQLSKAKGSLTDFSKSIIRALKHYIKDGSVSNENCPECGGKLSFSEGCKSCPSCGYSKCS